MAFVYSCCFWFSLRLGGILIAIFSIIQALITLIVLSIAQTRSQDVITEVTYWRDNINLIHTKQYVDAFLSDPDKYLTINICLNSVYIVICLIFIYGAFTCNKILMAGFILVELVRLIIMSICVATFLLVLKQNSMDIGLLIGASVASGFYLLGMFYLWVCVANLPILINEMERDEQQATIKNLQRMLEASNSKTYFQELDSTPVVNGFGPSYRKEVFSLSTHKNINQPVFVSKPFMPYQY